MWLTCPSWMYFLLLHSSVSSCSNDIWSACYYFEVLHGTAKKRRKKKLHLCSCMFGFFFSTEMLKNLLLILIQAGIYSFIAKEAFTPDNISESKASTKMICSLQMFKLCPLKVVNTSLYGLHITPSFLEDVWPSEGILAFISFSYNIGKKTHFDEKINFEE